MISGIYKITNILSNKIYIGSGIDINNRWAVHRYQLKNNKHVNIHLQNSYNAYGLDSFKFEIIEICEKEKFEEREQYWMDIYNSYDKNLGYNICNVARTTLGYKHSNEIKLKISASTKERYKNKDHQSRNKEKWPHKDGWKCQCNECWGKKREYYKLYDSIKGNRHYV